MYSSIEQVNKETHLSQQREQLVLEKSSSIYCATLVETLKYAATFVYR